MDYWAAAEPGTEGKAAATSKKDSKISLKTTFRSLLVYRLPHSHVGASAGGSATEVPSQLTLLVVTKEKKPKSKRLSPTLVPLLAQADEAFHFNTKMPINVS